MNSFNEKIVVVTGPSRGLGRETALRLAAEGATVVVHFGRHGDQAAEVGCAIRAVGGRAILVGGDLSTVDGVAISTRISTPPSPRKRARRASTCWLPRPA
ncbi:MAG: SDR family NAD(P)-dependent oxidoreductase [Pseudomonadota bacterium]